MHRLDLAGWHKLLAFSDRSQLTLPLGLRHALELPDPVRALIDARFVENAERWRRAKTAYREVAGAYESAGIECVVLKGFSHCPQFVADPNHRTQYDLDLWLPPEHILAAREIATGLGYEPIGPVNRLPVDHLPTMIRKTGWVWRGDYFDPDLPLSLELHFRLWDGETEKLAAAGLEEFWSRRESRTLDGLSFTALEPADAAAYASLHLLRHLLRGDLRPSHVYELAAFLDASAVDEAFWRGRHPFEDGSLRRLQTICFALARAWFACRLYESVQEEIERLPEPVRRWINLYAFSPLGGLFQPNKDELWLHLALLHSTASKAAVLRRRLLPVSLPGPVHAVHVRSDQLSLSIRVRRTWRYALFAGQRVAHHAFALPPFLVSAVRWTLSGLQLSPQYWRFLLAAGLFDFGLFIYFLLYNLYLLQLGFGEKFIGFVSSAMLAGGIAGSIPAGLAIRRFGLRSTLVGGFVIIAAVSGIRAGIEFGAALVILAFVAGLVATVWAVAISPAVAQLTSPENRSRGFSLVFSSGIAIGVLGGLVGGRLPVWLARSSGLPLSALHYRHALWASCSVVLLGAWAMSGVHLAPAERSVRLRAPGPALTRFLCATAVWNFGTGAFNPFFSAFFTRLHIGVETIGAIFSASQLAQVAAILIAPAVFRRVGLASGISGMQMLTGGALLLLAGAGGPLLAAAAYAAFMVFQYMSEPGLYTMLMDSVEERERSQASALNVLVASSAQALAAAICGAVVERLGYAPVMLAACLVCILAGFLFRMLLGSARQASCPDIA